MRVTKLLSIVLFTVSTITLAYGAAWEIKGKVPFQFTAGKTVLPAGDYEFIPDPTMGLVRVSTPKGSAVVVQVVTRLAAGIHTTAADAHAVFDKVGNTYTLSEIWLPDEDGFLLHVTKGAHEHHIVNIPHGK